jgi:hypothetical protein
MEVYAVLHPGADESIERDHAPSVQLTKTLRCTHLFQFPCGTQLRPGIGSRWKCRRGCFCVHVSSPDSEVAFCFLVNAQGFSEYPAYVSRE